MTTYNDVIRAVTLKGKFRSKIDLPFAIGRELTSEDKHVYLWNY
jgi:hypothetical protein